MTSISDNAPDESAFSKSLKALREMITPDSEAMTRYTGWQREVSDNLSNFGITLGYAKQDIFKQLTGALAMTETRDDKRRGQTWRLFTRENVDLNLTLEKLNASIAFLSDEGKLYQEFKNAGIEASDNQAVVAAKLINTYILTVRNNLDHEKNANRLYHYLIDRDKVAHDRQTLVHIRDALERTIETARPFNNASPDDEKVIGIAHDGTVSKIGKDPSVRIVDIPGKPHPLSYVCEANERMAAPKAKTGRLFGNEMYTAKYEDAGGKPCTYDLRIVMDNGKVYAFNSGPLRNEREDGSIPSGEERIPRQIRIYGNMLDQASRKTEGQDYNWEQLEAGLEALQKQYPPVHMQPKKASIA